MKRRERVVALKELLHCDPKTGGFNSNLKKVDFQLKQGVTLPN